MPTSNFKAPQTPLKNLTLASKPPTGYAIPMKITRWFTPAVTGSPFRDIGGWYVATMPSGEDGIGDTPAHAIADTRHEYRMMHDSAEARYCLMGRFHC